MPHMKRYEPHCPSPTCTEGHEDRLHPINKMPNWLPREVWGEKEKKEILYRCNGCGLIWFQERAKSPGFDARPVGYWEFGWELGKKLN